MPATKTTFDGKTAAVLRPLLRDDRCACGHHDWWHIGEQGACTLTMAPASTRPCPCTGYRELEIPF